MPKAAFLEVVGKERHAGEIARRRGGGLVARGRQRLVPVLEVEGAPADPGERHEVRLLVDVECADEGRHLDEIGIVGAVFEHPVGVVLLVGGLGVALIEGGDLGAEFAGLEDHERDLLGGNGKFGHGLASVDPPLTRIVLPAFRGPQAARAIPRRR